MAPWNPAAAKSGTEEADLDIKNAVKAIPDDQCSLSRLLPVVDVGSAIFAKSRDPVAIECRRGI